jgi:hypothetical protein
MKRQKDAQALGILASARTARDAVPQLLHHPKGHDLELMQADIDNKRADPAYKRGLLRYEPWRLAFTAFGAGAAVMAALVALLGYFGHH